MQLTTNLQVNWYNGSLARTSGGHLVLTTTSEDVTYPIGPADPITRVRPGESRHMQTAMIQSWNKFCFSEGAVELLARMPGLHNQEGLWPAFWLSTFAAAFEPQCTCAPPTGTRTAVLCTCSRL